MEIFILWLAFSVLAGFIASNKGRSGFGFFMLAVILSPLIGIIGALIAKPADRIEKEKALLGRSDEYKKCPMCAEAIRKEAIKCRYCGADLSPAPKVEPEYTREAGTHTALDTVAIKLGKAVGAALAHSPAKTSQKEKTLDEILAKERKV